MDNRPIKGNKTGKYTFVFDPNNDIPSYYAGQTDLSPHIVTNTLKVVKIFQKSIISSKTTIKCSEINNIFK